MCMCVYIYIFRKYAFVSLAETFDDFQNLFYIWYDSGFLKPAAVEFEYIFLLKVSGKASWQNPVPFVTVCPPLVMEHLRFWI